MILSISSVLSVILHLFINRSLLCDLTKAGPITTLLLLSFSLFLFFPFVIFSKVILCLMLCEDSSGEICPEKKVLYKLISGLHSSISIHIAADYLLDEATNLVSILNSAIWFYCSFSFYYKYSMVKAILNFWGSFILYGFLIMCFVPGWMIEIISSMDNFIYMTYEGIEWLRRNRILATSLRPSFIFTQKGGEKTSLTMVKSNISPKDFTFQVISLT